MEEKNVNKSRKAVKKGAKSPMIEVLEKQHKEPLELHFNIGDKDFTVWVKQHIDYSARSAIIPRVEDMFFPEGIYDPMYGESLLEFIIMQIYTDLDFNNDFYAFDAFRHEHSDIYHEIEANLPQEATDLFGFSYDLRDYLLEFYKVSDQQRAFYDRVISTCDSIKDIADSIVGMLDTASVSLHDVDASSIKDMLSAINYAGKLDDEKVVKAILDFQKAKAQQRVAVKNDDMPAVPHI